MYIYIYTHTHTHTYIHQKLGPAPLKPCESCCNRAKWGTMSVSTLEPYNMIINNHRNIYSIQLYIYIYVQIV